MSIVLNGTTGITTPDLTSVDDITANSATVLTTAGVPASAMPASSVLQVQYYQATSNGSTTSTSSSFVDDGVSVSITPLFATSKLYVVCATGCSVAGGYAYFRIIESASNTVIQEVPWGNFSGSPQQLNSFTMTAWFSPSNTATRTFKLCGATVGGTRYVNYSMLANMTVYEVAA